MWASAPQEARPISAARQRWRDAYASVRAFQLPPFVNDGRHAIRPGVDSALLAEPTFAQLAPLLSPVLPIVIEDNEVRSLL